MDRCKRCVVKRKRKDERKRRKREEKEGKLGDQIAKKVHAQGFPLCSRHIWDQSEIRFFGKSNLDLLSFLWKILSMSELGDIEGLNIHPHPHFCNSSKNLWQS